MRFMNNPFDILIVASIMLPSVWWPLRIIPYSPMAYSRPQSIHTHLYMNRSLHWVCMEAYSIAHKHVVITIEYVWTSL